MNLKFRLIAGVVAGVYLFISGPLIAGQYSNNLAKCLVKSTSMSERSDLIKWIFAAMASHPEVSALSNISAATRTDLNKKIAHLFVTLVAERCKKETRLAVKFESPKAISFAFKTLGATAARGLMSHPDVNSFIEEMDRYVDHNKLDSVVKK